MSVIQRIMQVARPYRGTLVTGLVLLVFSTFLDTAVIGGLIAALLALVYPQNPGVAGVSHAQAPAHPPFIRHLLEAQWVQQLSLGIHAQLDRITAWVQAMQQDPAGKGQLLIIVAVVTGFVVLLKCAMQGRANILMHKFSALVTRELRQRLFDHTIRLSPAYFEARTTGAHLSRITGDVGVLQGYLGPQLAEVLQAPLTIAIALLVMIACSWKLTLTALCLAPVIAVLLAVAGRKIRTYSARIQERLSELNGCLIERLSNIRVIQSFVREPYESTRVAGLNEQYYRDTMRSIRMVETLTPGVEFIAFLGMLAGIVIGGLAVYSGDLSGFLFLVFLTQAQKAGSQFRRLSRVNQLKQQVNATGARIFEVLDVVSDIGEAPDARRLPPVAGHIVFDNVDFRYGEGENVLSSIDFSVTPGDVVALVGPSGSGKTTLVNLLPRFYDPVAGRILVDGTDLRQVTVASLRAQVGVVPQETILFSGTIYENILYGKLDASEEEVVAAARAANALEFIERLPDGFATVVGERGARLSGGQRQRVAIARALLKNPRILVLDEATSALDTESEHLVQQALDRLMENRTTFVIAHRLSTVQHATRILVLDQGRIVEAGTHQELLAQGGLYRRLYEMQFRSGPVPAIPAPDAGM